MAERAPKQHFVQAAAPQGFTPEEKRTCNRWEAPKIVCDVPLQEIAGHRTDAHFSISRLLDFRDTYREPRVRAPNFPPATAQPNYEVPSKKPLAKGPAGLINFPRNGWRNQQGLRDWYLKNLHCELCEGDSFVMVGIPPGADMHHVYIYNDCPIPGLEFTVNLICPDDTVTPLLVVNADKCVAERVTVPDALAFHKDQNRIIEVVIDKFPPAKELNCDRPVDFGVLSNACFGVAVAGVCPITGK